MKLILEPTDRIETIHGQPHRIWEGTTDENVPVLAYIRAVSPQTNDPEQTASLRRALKELPTPTLALMPFDIRFGV